MAPSGRRLGIGPPVLRPPRELLGTVPLPLVGDAPSGPDASSTRGLPPTHRLLGSAAYGTPLPGGWPGAPLRGGHAPAGDEHPTGPVPTPAVQATSPDGGRGGNSLGVRGALVRGTSPSGRCRSPARPCEPGGAPRVGAQPVRGAQDEPPLPAPVTLGWDAGDVFSTGAVAQDELKLLARDSICPGRPSAQWGIVFGVSGAMCGVRDVAATLECLPGLHPTLGHVSLFQGDWRLPAIVQHWAAHMAVYQISAGRSVQVYSGGGGRHPPARSGGVRDVGAQIHIQSRSCGLQGCVDSSTAYVAANIDARTLGRYLRRSTALELPAKARQAVLRRLEHAVGPTGLVTLGTPAGDTACDHRGPRGLRAITLNLWRGLGGKVSALGSCLRGWGYPDLVGLQEVGNLPTRMVVHAMYWSTFTPAAHPAAGVGVLVRWHSTFREIWRDMHSSGRGIALEYHCRGGHVLAVVVYLPADQDLDMVRSILAWVLGVMAPRRGVYTLMMGDLNANPGSATGFRQAPAALTILWEEFMQDTGLTRCHPTTEVPTWTDGRGCVGVIDHILHGPAPKEGRLWVDEASPFPSDHRPVVWDALDAQNPEDRPPVRLRAGHFQIRYPGITGSYHAALSAARREEGPRPEGLAALYEYFRASTIRAVERAHGPPVNSGSSRCAWTRSIVSSKHTLSGAHGGGSH